MIDGDRVRGRLKARRTELQALSAMTAESRETVRLDQQSVGRLSRMDLLQQQAMAKATERQRSAELWRIELALKRIDDGDYGYCEDCGEPIAEKRLVIDPAASLCVRCVAR